MEMINYVFRDKNKNLIDYLKNLDLIFWAKVPQTDMYNYLKNISDNFDKNKFELIIKDIRNYIFEIPYYQKMENLNFSDEKTLKQRFEDVGLIPCLDNVITFSEIAEEKYRSICENSLQVTTPPPSMPVKLIKSLTINQQTYLYSKLTESLFLPYGTDFDSFCFVFGNSMKPDNFKPLRWLKNRQLLRELITALKHPDITIPTSKFNLPPYFIDKDNNPIIELPTNTPKDLKIEHYLENLAKM